MIQKRTGYDLDTIQAAIEALKHLNPRPGAQFTAENIPYVVPDIVVERNEHGDYDVYARRAGNGTYETAFATAANQTPERLPAQGGSAKHPVSARH